MMEGWEENGRGRNAGIPLGINKRSSRIGKNVRRVIQQPNRQQQQQAQPPPVYNINKNDFRNVVQRLTGSPLPETMSSPPPPPPIPLADAQQPKPCSSRLQKMRPPPLSSVNALPSPAFQKRGGLATPPLFSPLPPLTPGDAVWASPAVESPVSAYMRYLQQSMSNPSPRPIRQSPGPTAAPPLPSPRALPSPAGQFLLPSPLPSPFSMGAYFAQSPSAQFGLPLLPPPSPGLLFPLSPAGSSTAGFGREGFSFPDRNRRL